jgi:LysR family glycine cleavage system transcriptional activator
MLPRIMRFQSEHPELQLQITTTWRHDVDFDVEPFDAAIVYGTAPGAGVRALALFEERLTPVCSPQLAADKPLAQVGDLSSHTLLHPTRDHRDWKLWLSRAGAERTGSVQAEVGPSFDTLDLAINAAMQGFGVALGDVTLAAEDIAAKRLVTPFDLIVESGARYYLVCPDNAEQGQKVQRFWDWLASHRREAD